ncbi:MAG: DNA polymerase III subunit delta [Hallerella porci]|uniref:DNA polymerase III subunit delta n=1 Tax=Hallerella porci TaxID=1945871 RepID=UPI002A8400E9|nr:DNA polymerase III subunit delta [Hallerella porci]MDY3921514.1 DNA polymerase III subunit delta [Hallerella porci]
MIIVLIGDSEFEKERLIEQFLEKTLGDRKDDPLARKIIFANDSNVQSVSDAIIESCDSCSLFATEQSVVLRNAEMLKASDSAALEDWFKTKPDANLLLEFEKLLKTSKLYKALSGIATVKECKSPRDYEMAKWVTLHTETDLGRRIEPLAAEYIADALGTNQALIDSEIKKILLLDPEGKIISLEQAKLMIAPQREIAAFEIRESFGDRDPIVYTKKLRELLDSGVEGIQIVAALEAYAVRLLHIHTMLSRKISAKEIAAKLGANPWLFENKLNEPRKALNWPIPLLCRVIKRLGELDCEIKNGICDSRMGLELSLAALVIR